MTDPYKAEATPIEQATQSLYQLTEAYNDFYNTFHFQLLKGEGGERLSKALCVGLFQRSDIPEHYGVKSDQAQVFFGDWNNFGNLEGSLYTLYDDKILRIRWVGAHAIYLNHDGNYFLINQDPTTPERYVIAPRYLQGRSIIEMSDKGVETDGVGYHDYKMEMHEYKVRQARLRHSRLLRLQHRLGRLESGIEPVEPERTIIPHSELVSAAETITDGLRKTITTLQEAKVNFLPTLEAQ